MSFHYWTGLTNHYREHYNAEFELVWTLLYDMGYRAFPYESFNVLVGLSMQHFVRDWRSWASRGRLEGQTEPHPERYLLPIDATVGLHQRHFSRALTLAYNYAL